MPPTILAKQSPSSGHPVVITRGERTPFWALSTKPPAGSLLWVMNLARETDLDPAAVPGFMAHFGGEVSGPTFAVLDDDGPRFVLAPEPETFEFLGFVFEPTVDAVSLTDVARRTGITYSTLHSKSMNKGFPDPLARIGPPRWSWVDVEAWLWSPAAERIGGVMEWRAGATR